MAHTWRRLWSHVVAWENLCLAYRRARRGKRYRASAATFESRRVESLLALQAALSNGSWRPGGYRHFEIRRPKVRRISAAPFADRVVHHAIVNVLEPIYERRFVHDSYACRRGKGTHAALDRAHGYLRSRAWVLQGDVRKFFPSVDHEVLLSIVKRTVCDRPLLAALGRVLASGAGVLEDQAPPPWFPGDDLFAALRPRGLPIGNLTSQFLANVLLDVFDHFVLEEIRPDGYVRYCDDFLLFSDDRAKLRTAKTQVRARLAALRLHLHEKKTFVKPTRAGLHFLGFRMRPEGRRLTRESLRGANVRLRAQGRALRRGEARPADVAASIRAWCAHADHGNTQAVRQILVQRHGLQEVLS